MHDVCDMCGEVADDLVPMGADTHICARCAEEEAGHRAEEEEQTQRDFYADMAMDRRRLGEAAGFNKFMDRILVEEGHNRVAPKHEEDSPQRLRAARHQDRPLNKIRYGGK
jgi:ribosome-binding protein aMBF1 (putative translation factor)